MAEGRCFHERVGRPATGQRFEAPYNGVPVPVGSCTCMEARAFAAGRESVLVEIRAYIENHTAVLSLPDISAQRRSNALATLDALRAVLAACGEAE